MHLTYTYTIINIYNVKVLRNDETEFKILFYFENYPATVEPNEWIQRKKKITNTHQKNTEEDAKQDLFMCLNPDAVHVVRVLCSYMQCNRLSNS